MLCSAAHGMNARQRHGKCEHVSSADAFCKRVQCAKLTATCFEQLPSVHRWRLLLRAAIQRLRAGRCSPRAVVIITVVIITTNTTYGIREHAFMNVLTPASPNGMYHSLRYAGRSSVDCIETLALNRTCQYPRQTP